MLYNLKKKFYERMALNNMTAGRAEKAEKWYRLLEKLDPESPAVLHNLGVIYISLKKFDEAERYLLREIEVFGESGIRFRVLGDLYFMTGRRETAGKVYGKALTMLQDGVGDKSTIKFLRRKIKQCRDISSFSKARDGAKYYEEGFAFYLEGDYMKALDLYRKAVLSDNSSYMALNAAGTILMNHVRDYENARDYFQKALELADIPLIRNNLVLAEYKIREKGEKP